MYMQQILYQPAEELLYEQDIFRTAINGLFYVKHTTNRDERGFFSELARMPEIEKVIGHPFPVKQINQSRSSTGVVRGIHSEDWNKYATVTNGKCFCALVDLRPESPTFGKKEYFMLGFDREALDGSLFIPARIGNSMCVMEGPMDYLYFVDKLYQNRDEKDDQVISLFDPDLQIPWPIPKERMIISNRDKNAITLRSRFPEKF